MNGDGMKLVREWAGPVAMVLAAIVGYIQLAEEGRFKDRMFEPHFVERVGVISRNAILTEGLATKKDFERLEEKFEELSSEIKPLIARLVERGLD